MHRYTYIYLYSVYEEMNVRYFYAPLSWLSPS